MSNIIHTLGHYVPRHCKAAYRSEIRYRNFVLQFKEGNPESVNIAADMVVREIVENFDNVRTHFICAPAANEGAYRKRYKLFAEIVCSLCGMYNDFEKVHYFGTRLAIHELDDRGDARHIHAMMCCDIDIERGAKYVIFDDIITRGRTFETIKNYVEDKGGEVVGGYFLAKSIWR